MIVGHRGALRLLASDPGLPFQDYTAPQLLALLATTDAAGRVTYPPVLVLNACYSATPLPPAADPVDSVSGTLGLTGCGAHDSTGAQATVSPNVSFAGVAAACGYASAAEGDRLELLDEVLAAAVPGEPGTAAGSRFVRLMIRAGTPDGLPRPTITPAEVKSRLARHIGADHGEN